MFKDKLGQSIGLGDYVAYTQSGYVRIYHGIVTKFGNSNNVKVNDFDWAMAEACIVISKQVVGVEAAEANIEKYKDKVTQSRPSGGKVKFGVVYSGSLDRLFVITFFDQRELQRSLEELKQRLGLTNTPMQFVSRVKPRRYFAPHYSHFFRLDGYASYTERCLTKKALREIGMEEYIDIPEGMPYSESVFANYSTGEYKVYTNREASYG